MVEAVTIDRKTALFIYLTATFCTCLVVGDLIGGKLVSGDLFGFEFTTTVGMVPFPMTFVLTDVLNEYYGKRAARFVTFVAFFMALLTYLIVAVATQIPIAELTRSPDWMGVNEAAFENVFVGSQRMITASLTAYVVAQLVDISVFSLLKQATSGRMLWLRATGSTLVSQLIDTITITGVAWIGLLSLEEIRRIILSAYGLKLAIAILLTPILYALHAFIERALGIQPAPAHHSEPL